jgi:hypothetical protein
VTVIEIDTRTAPIFGRRLLDYAASVAPSMPRQVFHMPHVALGVASDSDGLLDLCRRALVDSEIYATGANPLDVVAIDRHRHPGMPQAHWGGAVAAPAAVFRDGLAGTGLEAAYDMDTALWHFAEPGAGRGVQSMVAPGQFPPWEASFPLRNFIHWALQSTGRRLVHAGTLGVGGKGVLIIGPGGSGKSGTTLAGIMAGLQSVGDDYIAMSLDVGGARAFPLMKLMKQDEKGLRRVGIDIAATVTGAPNWQNKYELNFETLGRGRRADSLELVGILLPRIAGVERSSFEPSSGRAAMMALAPSNLQQLPGGWREGLAFTAEVARRLPAYTLNLSSDPTEIADAVAGFIAGRRP